MGRRNGHIRNVLITAAVMLLLGGCAGLGPAPKPTETTPYTRNMISRLSLQNAALTTFKGTGTVRLVSRDGEQRNARVAWIGEAPDKLRLSVLNIGGLPMTTMAADGKNFFMASHTPKKFFKTRASNPNLDKLIGIRLNVEEIIEFLRGRVPIRQFDHAAAETDAATDEIRLTLSGPRGRILEKIVLSEDTGSITSVEMYDARENWMYTADFSDHREMNGYKVPFQIDILSRGDRLRLRIQRYWRQASTEPSTFMLLESEM
ncbi:MULTISPECIES: DUF4292 domain-containing protein [Desulfococcus]|uniref:Outer-membrane lipoprotein LolB n=1 Tax=Desulfococcus multivorans DSM 2059 TaxID=1121405 RepID=S7UJR7_DESML|nr:DUF4292 domain-containing protein [Desulfococcus multivorans]AQV01187.1 hypothetical protein B2D07_10670 [Desulfococcus multivorans]EPR34054.1 Protein of unknown function DUF4292 [Desulfococcus multivorans DSM 2059]SJZ53040.1 protein of unknown function [Desulfococcus multivorans DSM 2059]